MDAHPIPNSNNRERFFPNHRDNIDPQLKSEEAEERIGKEK
jgi:hypothetical protein